MCRRLGPILALLVLAGCAPLPDDAPDTAAAPIWNGEITADFPAVGALVRDGEARCTATLIDPRVALTAAHCVDGLTPADIDALTFYTGPGSPGPLSGGIPLEDVLPHPDYNDINADLALLFLAIDAAEEPIWVWDQPMVEAEWSGTLIELVGYGITGDGEDDAGQKRSTQVELYALDEDVFFHYLEGTNACFGDSGGPALWFDGERWWDLGVISALFPFVHKDLICIGGGGYEIRADLYLDWLAEHAEINAEPDPGDDDDDGDDDQGLEDSQGCQCAADPAVGAGTLATMAALLALAARRR